MVYYNQYTKIDIGYPSIIIVSVLPKKLYHRRYWAIYLLSIFITMTINCSILDSGRVIAKLTFNIQRIDLYSCIPQHAFGIIDKLIKNLMVMYRGGNKIT